MLSGDDVATFYYVEGETWAQAISNHPTENDLWSVDASEVFYNEDYIVQAAGGGHVYADDTIDATNGYFLNEADGGE